MGRKWEQRSGKVAKVKENIFQDMETINEQRDLKHLISCCIHLDLTRRMHLQLQSTSSKANHGRFIYRSHSSSYLLFTQQQLFTIHTAADISWQQVWAIACSRTCVILGLPSPCQCSLNYCSSYHWRMWKGSSRTPWTRPLLCSRRAWEEME